MPQRTAPRLPLAERFAAKVELLADGCWRWNGARKSNGYGMIGDGRTASGYARPRHAHIVAYELYVGKVPSGLELDHLCRNRWCVNPDHLEPVTHQTNMRRGAQATKPFCVRGHPRTPENLIQRPGYARCRLCLHERGLGFGRVTKLSDAAVREIRAQRKAGAKLRELAVSFGVAESTVSRVATGLLWGRTEVA